MKTKELFKRFQILKFQVFTSFLLLISNLVFAQTLYVPSGTSGIGSITGSNVGVGVSSPSQKLDVNGNLQVRGNIFFNTDGYPNIYLGSGTLKFQIGPTNPIMLMTSNNVLIGGSTINTLYKLDVNGALRATTLYGNFYGDGSGLTNAAG